MYLPFLGVALSNQFRQRKVISVEKMTPSAQVLYLYFLYRMGEQTVIKKQAAEDLHMTRMSVTRASEQLLAMQLITQEAHGKEQWMRAVASGMEYYKMAKPYLINPVQRVITTERTEEIYGLPFAGESALSLHSMLNNPVISVVAARKDNPMIQPLVEIDERWETGKNLIHIELWKYDPSLFSRENAVDPISLAVSLKDSTDERIQGELEEYLDGLSW